MGKAMILKGQKFYLDDAHNPSWPSVVENDEWVFWIPTSEGSFYHRDRVRRLKACGILPRGQIPLDLGLESVEGEKEPA